MDSKTQTGLPKRLLTFRVRLKDRVGMPVQSADLLTARRAESWHNRSKLTRLDTFWVQHKSRFHLSYCTLPVRLSDKHTHTHTRTLTHTHTLTHTLTHTYTHTHSHTHTYTHSRTLTHTHARTHTHTHTGVHIKFSKSCFRGFFDVTSC